MTASEMAKRRWEGIPAEQRRAHAQMMARKRHQKTSARQRKESARKANQASQEAVRKRKAETNQLTTDLGENE